MRVIFMGTSEFAVPSLISLHNSSNHEVVLVVTQPDSKQGRGLRMSPSPIKTTALELMLPVIQTERIGTVAFRKILSERAPDIIFCAAYGKFLTEKILSIPKFGAVNLHPSLLPKYRGAAPVQRALMDDQQETGITFFRMVKEMDAGDILYQEKVSIDPAETAGELLERTAILGASRLPALLDDIAQGNIKPVPQDDDSATYAPLIDKNEGMVDWSQPAVSILNLWRGLTPEPGIFTFLNGRRIRLSRIAISKDIVTLSNLVLIPGSIVCDRSRLFVATGQNGFLEILNLQPEGKKYCDAASFINGYHPNTKRFG